MTLGQRLNVARVALNLDPEWLATQARIKAADLLAYESDTRTPSQAVLNLLTGPLAMDKLYFARQSDLPQIMLVSSRAQRLDEAQIDVLAAQTMLWMEHYLDLDALGRLEQSRIFEPPAEFPLTATKPSEVTMVADSLRRLWGLEDQPIYHLIELLESKGIVIAMVNVSETFDACAMRTDDEFMIPIIGVQQGLSAYTQRFAIARELGHLLLDELSEANASQFAGAMLMCATNTRTRLGHQRQDLSAEEVLECAAVFGTSPQHVLSRAASLKIIDKDYYSQLMEAGRSQGWSSLFGTVSQPNAEQPMLLGAMMGELVARDARSEGMISSLLAMPWLN